MKFKSIFAGLALMLFAQSASARVFVHLFEWKWTDVAQECEQFLGPKGFTAVQVSPAMEHISGPQWWTRYQPVSYELQSRSGTEQEFIDMVSRCKAAGVDIYADAVINHMAANSGVGTAGHRYSVDTLSFPDYGPEDFHDYCAINEADYTNNAWRVRHCRLNNLSDLKTEDTQHVQPTIANYLNHLLDIGVAGFRLDGSKHMDPSDIAGILSRLDGQPFIFQEVIDHGGEPISSSEYFDNGDVTEFKYTSSIGDAFKSSDQRLAYLRNWGPGWGLMESDKAIVFTDNHDNQRDGGDGILTYKDGDLYTLANVFMLAHPYGYPKIMSSYYYSYDNTDAGPGDSLVWNNGQPSGCGQNWVCEHRQRAIANMVGFRNASEGHALSNWWDNNNNQIAFGRSGYGFVIINRENNALNHTFTTGMSDGSYCNVIAGDPENRCEDDNGQSHYLEVTNGELTTEVPAMSAVAIYQGSTCSGNCEAGNNDTVEVTFTCENGTTHQGQSVYAVGNIDELGRWSLDDAVRLQPQNYPTWSKTLTLPRDTDVQWKCVKHEENDSSEGVVWQSGNNNTFNTSRTQNTRASF